MLNKDEEWHNKEKRKKKYTLLELIKKEKGMLGTELRPSIKLVCQGK